MTPRQMAIGVGCILGFAAIVLTIIGLNSEPSSLNAQDKKESKSEEKTDKKDEKSAPGKTGETITTKSGLKYIDEKIGDGAEAIEGMLVKVHYTGTLENGKKFDSSRDRGTPFDFPLGAGRVIKGWDEGVAGMKVGGKRKLIIPPDLGYGKRGAGGVIPPDAVLIFEVELVGVSK